MALEQDLPGDRVEVNVDASASAQRRGHDGEAFLGKDSLRRLDVQLTHRGARGGIRDQKHISPAKDLHLDLFRLRAESVKLTGHVANRKIDEAAARRAPERRRLPGRAARQHGMTLRADAEAGNAKGDADKRAGATGWIVKPVSGDDLIKVIKKVLPGA